jgi:hypothetical protein
MEGQLSVLSGQFSVDHGEFNPSLQVSTARSNRND